MTDPRKIPQTLSPELEAYLEHVLVLAEMEINAEDSVMLRGVVQEVRDFAEAVRRADDMHCRIVLARAASGVPGLSQSCRFYDGHRVAMRTQRGTE